MPRIKPLHVVLVLVLLSVTAYALDPLVSTYEFKYTLYPPGINPKRTKIVPAPAKNLPKGTVPLINAQGQFDEWAMFYYKITTDPEAFRTWWVGYWSDESVWHTTETPCFKGYQPGNQGHRIIAFLGQFADAVQKHPDIDPAIKAKVCSEEWKRAVEKIIRDETIDERGFLAHRVGPDHVNTGNLAQTFHFIRTKYGAMKLKFDNIYTLEKAQDAVVHMLTDRTMICAEDTWMTIENPDILEHIGEQKGGKDADIRFVKDNKLLYTGGLFIGWFDKPSLHGTWDGLAMINSFFRYYPEPDPNNPKSIFYKWNQLPEEKKQIGKKTIKLCADRLWLDYKERNKPIWNWVREGKVTNDDSRPSEAPWKPAYDGYGENQLGWATQCWTEIFGDALRNTNDGCQALLAIANGKILEKLTMPVGEQVPNRYNFNKEVQLAGVAEDLKKLDDPEQQKFVKEKYGLTVEQAKARIEQYVQNVGLPPGQTPVDEAPKLDPAKAGKKPTKEE